MTSDTVPKDMPGPLLRSMVRLGAGKKKPAAKGASPPVGEPRACGGRGREWRAVEQRLMGAIVGSSYGLLQLIVLIIVIDFDYLSVGIPAL